MGAACCRDNSRASAKVHVAGAASRYVSERHAKQQGAEPASGKPSANPSTQQPPPPSNGPGAIKVTAAPPIGGNRSNKPSGHQGEIMDLAQLADQEALVEKEELAQNRDMLAAGFSALGDDLVDDEDDASLPSAAGGGQVSGHPDKPMSAEDALKSYSEKLKQQQKKKGGGGAKKGGQQNRNLAFDQSVEVPESRDLRLSQKEQVGVGGSLPEIQEAPSDVFRTTKTK